MKPAWLISTIEIAAVIRILALVPPHVLPRGPWGSDKLAQMLVFLRFVFPKTILWPRIPARVAVLAVAFGGSTELIQPFSGQSADFADLVAAGTGVGLRIILESSLLREVAARRAG